MQNCITVLVSIISHKHHINCSVGMFFLSFSGYSLFEKNALIQCVIFVQRSLKKLWFYIKNMMDILHLSD